MLLARRRSGIASVTISTRAGGGSQAVSLIAVLLAAALLFGGAELLAFVPHAALGGILIAVALRIFRLNEIVNIAHHGGSEIWLGGTCQ